MLETSVPHRNFAALSRNPYPGRGIVIGRSRNGNAVMVYWIMGRSENSRNRVFMNAGGRLYTAPAHPAKVTDPSLIIYNAMRDDGSAHYVVSNGHQTDAAFEGIIAGKVLSVALKGWSYEPDAPNHTPRITGRYSTGRKYPFELSIIRRASYGGEESLFVPFDAPAQTGRCITTYEGDGTPLPSFAGEPYEVPLEGTPSEIAETYWSALNPEHRVALAVKYVATQQNRSLLHIINRYKKH